MNGMRQPDPRLRHHQYNCLQVRVWPDQRQQDKTPEELMNPQEKADLAHKVLDHERNPKEELPDATKTAI